MADPNMLTLMTFLMAKSTIKRKIRRLVLRAILMCFAIFCLLMALLSGVLSLWFVLLPKFGPVITSLILSGGFMVLCLIFVVAAQWGRRAQRKAVLEIPDVPLASLMKTKAPQAMNSLVLGAIVFGLAAGLAGKRS